MTLSSSELKNSMARPDSVQAMFKLFANSFSIRYTIEANYCDVATTNTLIYGHPNFGEWMTFNWGDEATVFPTTTNIYIVNSGDKFFELFDRNDYIDETLSTGTLNTTSKTYVLDDGEVLISKRIAYDGRLFTDMTITSETCLQFASFNDGNTWQTVTNITSGGTCLKYKLENNSGSAITITSVTVEYL